MKWPVGSAKKLLRPLTLLPLLLLPSGMFAGDQGQATAVVTFTVSTYLDVRYVCDGTRTWTVVATSRDFCETREFLAKGNVPYVVQGSLQVISGSGTWSFDLNPSQWGNQSAILRPAGIFQGLATVRYSQRSGKVNAKAKLTLSIVAQ